MIRGYWCRRCGRCKPADHYRMSGGTRRPVVKDCLRCEASIRATAWQRAGATIRRLARTAV